ncbi:hypothetical protein Adt_40791 [Abeliophyllum distichum]|uniref:Uncharacterized protein n=1 Tax=Abeliophyllum distichum TaxID=126358 RepID=A0ABD1PM03_9LAMI
MAPPKINFTKPKKNSTSAPTPKVVQTKINLKAKGSPPAKKVVIKEPSPNSRRSTTNEVVGKGKEEVVEPPPKVKPISNQAPSSSKATQLRSFSGVKMPSLDSRSRPAKRLRTGVSSGPPIVEIFQTRPEGLQPSTMVSSLPSFFYLGRTRHSFGLSTKDGNIFLQQRRLTRGPIFQKITPCEPLSLYKIRIACAKNS